MGISAGVGTRAALHHLVQQDPPEPGLRLVPAVWTQAELPRDPRHLDGHCFREHRLTVSLSKRASLGSLFSMKSCKFLYTWGRQWQGTRDQQAPRTRTCSHDGSPEATGLFSLREAV